MFRQNPRQQSTFIYMLGTPHTVSEARRRNMQAIKSKNTKPELLVRSAVHRLGYHFRLHKRDLPGSPDLVFTGRQKVIFVHGCFWHQHSIPGCKDGRVPRSNNAYWKPKLSRTIARDAKNTAALKTEGWAVLVIWECETKNAEKLRRRLQRFLDKGG